MSAEPLYVHAGNPATCNPAVCELHRCLVCNEVVCPIHQDDVTECVEGGYHHREDCKHYCMECEQAAWEDEQEFRAECEREAGRD